MRLVWSVRPVCSQEQITVSLDAIRIVIEGSLLIEIRTYERNGF